VGFVLDFEAGLHACACLWTLGEVGHSCLAMLNHDSVPLRRTSDFRVMSGLTCSGS
jgi:hypothetical protein